MAKTQYYCACTLDGYIADADDGLDWLTEYEGSFDGPGAEPMKGSYDEFFEGVGSLVMGSTTYEWVLEHVDDWLYAGKPTWVLSSRDLPQPDGDDVDVRVAAAKPEELHEELVAAAGGRGGAT